MLQGMQRIAVNISSERPYFWQSLICQKVTTQNYCTQHAMLLTAHMQTLNMILLFVIKLQDMSEMIFC
jgi:hypothetical protein